MTKRMHIAAMVAGLLVMGAAAGAQTLNPTTEGGPFVSLAVAGQPQTRSFSSGGALPPIFGETGSFQINQNIGRAIVLDVAGGYRFGGHLGAGVGVWFARSQSAVAATAAIPDPLFFGRFTTVTLSDDNRSANTMGVNIMLMWTQPISNKIDATISLGPTITRTSVDVASITIPPSGNLGPSLSFETQSKTSAKGGNVGVDIDYRANEQYAVGLLVRFAGGEVDLPAVSKLKVGGLQIGAIVRYHF